MVSSNLEQQKGDGLEFFWLGSLERRQKVTHFSPPSILMTKFVVLLKAIARIVSANQILKGCYHTIVITMHTVRFKARSVNELFSL